MTEKVCRNCKRWKKESQKGGECKALHEHVFAWPCADIHLWTAESFSCMLFEEMARPFSEYFEEGIDRWRVGYRRTLDDEWNLAPEKYGLNEITASSWAAWLNRIWREERDKDGEGL